MEMKGHFYLTFCNLFIWGLFFWEESTINQKMEQPYFLAPLFCTCATLELHWFGLGGGNNRKHVHSAQRNEGLQARTTARAPTPGHA
jgi:hypothetical protein